MLDQIAAARAFRGRPAYDPDVYALRRPPLTPLANNDARGTSPVHANERGDEALAAGFMKVADLSRDL